MLIVYVTYDIVIAFLSSVQPLLFFWAEDFWRRIRLQFLDILFHFMDLLL